MSQNITQKELSDRTGMTQADISRIENDTRNFKFKVFVGFEKQKYTLTADNKNDSMIYIIIVTKEGAD